MKYARIFQQYKYSLETWNGMGNIGDCIQNLAVENLYKELGLEPSVLINRDELVNYNGEKVYLPMQGWYGNLHNVFLPDWSTKIHPIFIGFHLNNSNNCRKVFVEKNIDKKMKNFEPIGCRDRKTADFLESLGINAYFSGCLTLTFPKREKEPENGKIFIVDLIEKALEIVPENIKQKADFSITHSYEYKNYPVTKEEALEFENEARKILNRYKNEAKLIITSRIHVAMPCIAMGIPVIFIHSDVENIRFDVLDGIIQKFSPTDVSIIDWNPKVPDIEDLKKEIKDNAKREIKRVLDNTLSSNQEELEKITQKYFQRGKGYKSAIERSFINYIEQNKNIVFWGASQFLEKFFGKNELNKSNIIGIIDKNPELKNKKIAGIKVYAPEDIKTLNPNLILLSIFNNSDKMYKLIQESLKEEKINIPFLNPFS